MLYQGWNDYELIYLINEGNEPALNLMYLKYENMIAYKAKSCGCRSIELDDYIQEGLILLTSAIKSFKPSLGKTFYRYFEIILLRAFWRQRKKDSKLSLDYNFTEAVATKSLRESIEEYASLFTGTRQYIYKEIFLYSTPANVLAKALGVKTGKIYYEVKKIKEILRQEFDL